MDADYPRKWVNFARRLTPAAYNNWGNALSGLGRYEEALEKYGKAIELKPDLAKAYYNWGYTLNGLGKYNEAIEKYNKAIELKPDYREAYYNRGIAYNTICNYKLATNDFRIAAKLGLKAAQDYLMNPRGGINPVSGLQHARF